MKENETSRERLFKKGDSLKVSMHGFGKSGEGVGYCCGFTVFVEGALPGENVQVELTECKKNYGRGRLTQIINASPHRVKPKCTHFGKCGGCQIMHLDYSNQLLMKRQRVQDSLERIGKLKNIRVEPCVPSPSPFAYRNKIQLPVKAKGAGLTLGMYETASHNFVELDKCQIHCDMGENVFQTIKDLIQQTSLTAYQSATHTGELRHVLIKSSLHLDQVLVIFVTTQIKFDTLKPLAELIMKKCPHVKGVIHNFNSEKGNRILGERYHVIQGALTIQERIGGLLFHVSPASFFQVNIDQAEYLYQKALEFSQITDSETVLDAYCGVGTISLFFAQRAKHVTGVECVSEAIEDAKKNAKLNEINNVEFICANAEDYITKLKAVDVVVLNPPRKGCESKFLEGLHRLKPKRIVYISCDPASLARDLQQLCSYGYEIVGIQPFDMFPQTAHVECVVNLKLSS